MRSLLLVLALGAAACGGKSSPSTAAPDKAATDNRSLFERLGGQPAINAVVHEFCETTKADPRISQFFMNVDQPKLEQAMDDHVCEITGGGCQYKGKSMLEAHTGMKVSEEHFAAFMDDLEKTLVKMNVPERERGEVLGAFNGLKPDVVAH